MTENDRLTHHRANAAGYWSAAKKQDLVDRLAAYEDTGLMPEEIRGAVDWIPCSVRLPENDGFYTVTMKLEFPKLEFPDVLSVNTCGFHGEKWDVKTTAIARSATVIAWKPMLMPYKEEKE